YGLNAVPLAHEKIDEWRDSLRRGITYHFPNTNLLITGGVDDVWITPDGELIIVDYKATSKEAEVTTGKMAINAKWRSISGFSDRMGSRSPLPDTSCIVMVLLIKICLMGSWNLISNSCPTKAMIRG
ncbi:MAG TPA: hypothetical protein DEG92_04765, partial [Rikenellaceae bacterium]|nr:hypothetical protein [Rikenellaceae bacterium]